MKNLLLTYVCAIASVAAVCGQSVDYNKIILPDGASNVSFEERLVQIAWLNNPASKIAELGVTQAVEEGKAATRAWTQTMGVSGNLNEFSIKEFNHTTTPSTTNNFYPRYNIFVNIPIALFAQTPHIKNAAHAKAAIAVSQVNLTKLSVRSTVLKLYSEYKKAELVLLIRKQSASDDESNYLLIEQKFKNGDVLVDDYMKAQRGRNDIKILLAIAENDFRKSKLDLEEIIGMRLEDVK